MKRESGYYWIKKLDTWSIGEYDSDDGSWFMDGSFWYDYEFQQIDENQIKRAEDDLTVHSNDVDLTTD